MLNVSRTLAVLLTAGACLAPGARALAQAWQPSKPVQIVVPISPGGGADIVLRTIMPRMSEALGQPMLLNHKPGANAIIGTEFLARAAPDGHTIGYVTDQHSINPLFAEKLPYDPAKDFAPVSQLVEGYFLLLANPALGFKSVADVVRAAKSQPGKLTYGTPGIGSPHHISMESFNRVAGTDIQHVPFKGTPEMVSSAAGGHIDLLLLGTTSALAHARSGKLAGLAVTSPQRLPSAPDIPTVGESGVPGYVASFWYGLMAPAGTPPQALARLSQEVGAALRSPEVQKQLAGMDLVPRPSTPQEFASFLKKDAAKYAGIVKSSGAKRN
jgi:tripartite-type tricarboxylate transporter receptor subunit TctC